VFLYYIRGPPVKRKKQVRIFPLTTASVCCNLLTLRRVENLIAALWLYFAHYNFVRIHTSLRVTPAMAANATDHVWSMEELLNAGARS